MGIKTFPIFKVTRGYPRVEIFVGSIEEIFDVLKTIPEFGFPELSEEDVQKIKGMEYHHKTFIDGPKLQNEYMISRYAASTGLHQKIKTE